MKLNVPEPVAAYLDAQEAKDVEKLAFCFTDDGTVRDEGEDHHGSEAIQTMETKGGREVPICLAAASRSRAGRRGNHTLAAHRRFSRTVELDHIFKLSGDKIASLEIRP